MDDHDFDRATAVSELQQLLVDTDHITGFLNELARYAATTIAPDLSCGITMDRKGGPLTVASSDAHALSLDEVQYGHHNGPCLTSMHTGTTVTISDLATDDSWGAYRLDALAHGIASALSIPLAGGPGVRGALNLYVDQPEVFTTERQRRAEGLGEEASRALRLAVRLTDQVELTQHLEAALVSRTIIDQAIGIIMGQNRCTAADAFEILRRASHHRNIKLRAVAEGIVIRVGGEPPDPGATFAAKPADHS
ncbi:MAG: GAF and ANTAR domain-containing protein [Pseudonocardiaceae bacterium]